jgi:UDP-glucose 4-epimerase
MNILITGCTGNLGSLLAERFISLGHAVTGVARDPGKGRYRLIIADLADEGLEGKLQGVEADLVVHLAAVIPRKMADKALEEKAMFEANVNGTLNLLGVMHKKSMRKMIFASSMAVYGLPRRLPVDESQPLVPLSYYGLTKKQGEEHILQACEEQGMTACMFRFPSFFGPQINAGAVRSFCTKAAAGEDIVINPETAASWDLLHIRDAMDIIVRCAERMQNGKFRGAEAFNVDYGVPVSLSSVAESIVKLSGSRSKIKIVDNDKVVEFYFDISKSRKALDWNPPALETRLKEYMAEIKEGAA